MAIIKEIRGIKPKIGKNCWFAENATLIGDLILGDNCTVWFNAVIRGDVNSIRIGNNVNIQDNATIHCTYKKTQTIIGNNVSIAHNAVVHGCKIGDNVVIGIGAIILDNAIIRANSIIAAGAVVLEGTEIESGSIYGGIPAKKIKTIPPEMFKDLNQRISKNYIKYSELYK